MEISVVKFHAISLIKTRTIAASDCHLVFDRNYITSLADTEILLLRLRHPLRLALIILYLSLKKLLWLMVVQM